MVNAQEWLDEHYPNKNQTTYIDAKNKELEGNFVIKDFPNLEKVDCSSNKKLTSIGLDNLPKLNYFRVGTCQLSSLVVNNCPNVAYLDVGNNLLTSTKFLSGFGSEKLNKLSVHSNNFEKQGLEIFSQFVNLKELYIDNSDEDKFNQGIYNHFVGSLKPLQNLKKLQWLSLAKTDVDSGIEYLPLSVKKVGVKKDWSPRDNSGCAKIARELERVAQVSEVTEKLVQEEENEPLASRGKATWYRIAPWWQARDLLGEEGFRSQISQQDVQSWLDKYYPKENNKENEKRKNIDFLNNISGKNLAGRLDLSDFANLEGLDCSRNQLTSLDLSKCENLTKINCSGNKFTSIDFLSEIPNKEKLKKLKLNDNEELKGNLVLLASFTGLVELDIRNCPLYGSLESLQKLNNLERIFISNTHISEGLEYLPDSCKEFYCDTSDYKYKSMEIVKELGKFLNGRYYDISKWKEDNANNKTVSVVPLERLFVIRNNLKQFINKWGKSVEDDWVDNLVNFVSRDKEKETNLNELSKLQSPNNPDELKKDRWAIYGTQAFGRSSAVVGAILTFQDQSAIGGGILGIYPITELLVSKLDERLKNKESKWKEFLNDADNFLDNYHELLAITKSIRVGKLGKINEKFKDLKKKVDAFLKEYNTIEEKGEIALEELKGKRKELAKELVRDEEKSKLWAMIKAINQLEKKVIAYRQGIGVEEKNTSEPITQPVNENSQQLLTQTPNIVTSTNWWKGKNLLREVKEQQGSNNQSQQDLLLKHEVIEMQSLEQEAKVVQNRPIPGSSNGNK